MKASRPQSRSGRLLGAVVLTIAGGAGIAGAASASSDTAEKQAPVSTTIGTSYPVNAAGQTYGKVPANIQENLPPNGRPAARPDLLSAVSAEGHNGYIDRAELDEVTGGNVSSPKEAIEWQKAHDAPDAGPITIPVYQRDGKTRVGTFKIG